MVFRHLAAIFFFSGPLFYLGLLMAVDPAGLPTVIGWCCEVSMNFLKPFSGLPSSPGIAESSQALISGRLRRAVRWTGLVLLVLAIVI